MLERVRPFLLPVAAAASLASCASVHVIKVSDDAPQPEGIPFYLPRPYVQVYEPFVIGAKAYLVSGMLSPDGKYLLIDNVSDAGRLDGLFRSDLNKEGQAQIPVNTIREADATTGLAMLPGGAQGDPATPAAPAAAPAASAAASAATPATSAPTGSQPVGNFNVSVTNTTSLFPPTLGRRFFDVVWMPDFEEKYVVQGKPGLGNSSIGVTMTQGWGLYGLDAKVDNSAIVKPLLDFYSTSLDALSKLAKSKILPASLLTGGAQGAINAAALPAGARVTVKVTRVQVVAPGLYPMLKPKERSTLTETSADATRDLVTRHLPLRPYTNIAFNTYEVVVLEAAKASGDTPMNLQSYFDPTSSGSSTSVSTRTLTNPTADGSATTPDPATLQDNVNALLANRKGTDGAVWKISGLKQQGANLTGKATLSGGSAKPTGLATMADLGTFVANQTGSKFLPGNVKLTEAK